jgi:inner membrane protein
MFVFGHLGLGAAPGALAAKWWGDITGYDKGAPDLRWYLTGILLPDLVDKPVGQMFFKPYFENGRIYCHTILFTSSMLAVGIHRWRRKDDNRLLLLALGVVSHMVFDGIWNEPETVMWPLLGPFKRYPSLKGVLGQIAESLRDPSFWAEEIGGFVLLLLALRTLGIQRYADLKAFLLHGMTHYLVPSGADH